MGGSCQVTGPRGHLAKGNPSAAFGARARRGWFVWIGGAIGVENAGGIFVWGMNLWLEPRETEFTGFADSGIACPSSTSNTFDHSLQRVLRLMSRQDQSLTSGQGRCVSPFHSGPTAAGPNQFASHGGACGPVSGGEPTQVKPFAQPCSRRVRARESARGEQGESRDG